MLAGGAVPVPYNGSVARLSFGPVVAARVRRWLKEGRFDVLHLHEPATPSIALLALWAAECPVVATFHTSNVRSRAMSASAAILRPSMEKITGRIAVSEYARDTLVHHIGGEPVVIPNGVYVDHYARAEPARGVARPGGHGRLRRPDRRAAQGLRAARRGLRPAGRRPARRSGCWWPAAATSSAPAPACPPAVRGQVEFLGRASDADKASALRTADVYVAPNTGGESFGIVLVEAMAAGATVLASDIPAFRRVLDGGRYGELFRSEDVDDLTARLGALLDDPDRRAALDAAAAQGVRRYDWSTVATRIVQVYETVAGGGA